MEFPVIPNKLYFTIGEVAQLCALKPHLLRYWEHEFSQLRPIKRCGNRRYYRREDVFLIWRIRQLLYEQGYTIEGARQQLLVRNSPVAVTDQMVFEHMLSEAIIQLEQLMLELASVSL